MTILDLSTFLQRVRDARQSTARPSTTLRAREAHRIKIAYALAEDAHGTQTRVGETDENGEPKRYFEHPLTVALYLAERLSPDADDICVALLHDTLEDTELLEDEIRDLFGDTVLTRVVRLSQLNAEPKADYAARLVCDAAWCDIAIKVCDILHNSQTIHGCSDDMRSKFVHDVVKHYYPLMDRAVACAPPQLREAVEEMYQAIRDNIRRCRRSLAA